MTAAAALDLPALSTLALAERSRRRSLVKRVSALTAEVRSFKRWVIVLLIGATIGRFVPPDAVANVVKVIAALSQMHATGDHMPGSLSGRLGSTLSLASLGGGASSSSDKGRRLVSRQTGIPTTWNTVPLGTGASGTDDPTVLGYEVFARHVGGSCSFRVSWSGAGPYSYVTWDGIGGGNVTAGALSGKNFVSFTSDHGWRLYLPTFSTTYQTLVSPTKNFQREGIFDVIVSTPPPRSIRIHAFVEFSGTSAGLLDCGVQSDNSTDGELAVYAVTA